MAWPASMKLAHHSTAARSPAAMGSANRHSTLVTPRDPVALAEVVGPLLESPSRRAEFARAGLERVRSRYSWDHVAEETAAVYQQTVRRQGVGHALSAASS
jgi:spore maturation protein CgeB